MPHIDLDTTEPGIVGLFRFRPETARPLRDLAEALLRGPGPLTRGERELIATVVSTGNRCEFCSKSHGAVAARELPGGPEEVRSVLSDRSAASPKLRALLRIADKVREDAKFVTEPDIDAARQAGASDVEIHDTVLIAAAFCMYNRYVDGLATVAAATQGDYEHMAETISDKGYAATVPVVQSS